ncbi:MAG: C25 family cysteine peptidase, partial [Candidatus Promineifilaceae bacterium]
ETHKLTETVLEPGVLRDGNNVLVFDNLSVISDKNSGQESIVPIDIMRLDWIEVDFNGFPRVIEDSILLNGVSGDVRIEGFSEKPIIIDISNPDAPKQVIVAAADDNVLDASIPAGLVLYAAGEEAVQSRPKIESVHNGMLSNPATQADLIILTTSELSPTMTSLADWRREQGLSVTVVDVADVYNEFGAGEESPESITAFLEYALSTWQPPSPQYLLIVGDASYDYRNYLGQSNSNLIPSPMVRVAYGGETVSDANMADIDSDGWPDIAVGRWPVRNANQAEDLIDRTIAYEKEASSGRVLLAADGTSTEFSSLSDSVLKESNLPEDSAVKLYGATTAEFTEAWNEGAWLVSYAGHGSIDRWGKEGVFSAEGVPNLNAEGSPPVVIQLTCLTGYYAHPEVESISESLLQHQSGPVEIIAATSLTLSSNQKPFGVAFFREMQQDENYRIGDALQKAKLSLDVEHSRALKEISETFTLLGDPSALIARPQR